MKTFGVIRTVMVYCPVLVLSTSVFAAQPQNSNVEFLRPAELDKTTSFVPGSAHGHVRQQLEYGKGFRYGHSVNSALGDIVIWSAAPNRAHGGKVMRAPTLQPRRPANLSGPKLQFKPDYGKTSKAGYGR